VEKKMKRLQKSVLALAFITTFMGTFLIFPGIVCGEDGFYVIPVVRVSEENCTRDDGFYVIPVQKRHSAPVEKTGQTEAYATGDDGDLEKGVAWPNPRFTDNGDGTVTDNLTELVWLKDANCFGQRAWADGLSLCNSLADGSCGLTDDSIAGEWRLPHVRELDSLVHYAFDNPALPDTAGTDQWTEGNPFSKVEFSYYWSSTTLASDAAAAWLVRLSNGIVSTGGKSFPNDVWCVRSGK
jgi:hypothetical protein